MSDKVQLIKQEIERRYNCEKCHPLDREANVAAAVLQELLLFINSLPEEPVNEDLEEEMIRWHKQHFNGDRDWDKTSGEYLTRKSQLDIARHFAEWQKQQDYKMYAHVLLKDIHDAWQELKKNKSDIENYPAVCFQKGADWRENHMKELLRTEYEKGRFDMREEMMKDAVDATIFSELKGNDGSLFQAKSNRFRMNGVKISDRIKVIPIKLEQQ